MFEALKRTLSRSRLRAARPTPERTRAGGKGALLFDDEFQRKLESLALVSRRVFAGRMRAERRSKKKGSGVEFADHRAYVYNGHVIDHQDHLGFDLAVTANHPIEAANDGLVMLAKYFGIYGNTVVLDHGYGLMTLYAHLSSIDVKPGDMVNKEQTLGRSGMTGLAEGDHLHFTMLVNGKMVNPVEWWDSHWIQDRILRKLRTPGA